ncbi:MAG: hypothetical protein WC565_09270 [Parcubacteria group bacterium]
MSESGNPLDADNVAILATAKGKTVNRTGWGKSPQEFLLEFADGQILRLFVNLYEEIDVCWLDVPASVPEEHTTNPSPKLGPLYCSNCGRDYKTLESFMRHRCANEMREELTRRIEGTDREALHSLILSAFSQEVEGE